MDATVGLVEERPGRTELQRTDFSRRLRVKNKTIARLMMCVSLAVAFAVVAVSPLKADSILLQTSVGESSMTKTLPDANLTETSGANSDLNGAVGFTTTTVLDTYDTAGWVQLTQNYSGGSLDAGTQAVTIAPTTGCPGNCPSGYVLVGTFSLPVNAYGVTITGVFAADDEGVVYLNGNPISTIGGGAPGTYTTFIDSSYFNVGGTNYLTISDDNSLLQASGVELEATVTYSLTPEPGTLLLLGSGLVGIAGMVRRKMGARA
jgi:hypothetical protein